MKLLSHVIVLFASFTVVFSWKAVFEKLEKIRDKGEDIKKHLDFKSLGLSSLKDLNLKDLVHFQAPDLHSKLENLKHIIPKDLDPSHHREVDEFWSGAFEEFGLPRPTELIECFGTVSGPIFFRTLRTMNDLVQHSKSRDNVRLHADLARSEVLMHALEHTHKCLFNSHDFERAVDSLGLPHDPQALINAKYLYYEAKYPIIADDYQEIIDQIDKRDFQNAGKLLAKLYKKSIKQYKEQGEDLLTYQAFGNGLSTTLGLDPPTESIKCYNAEQARALMKFFEGLSYAVAEGKWYKADQSLAEYWDKEGKSLLNQIPDDVWKCDMKSNDSKQISEKIGVDLGGQEFRDKMWNYVSDHNIMFYSYIRSMKSAISKGDYLHAGAAYAHLLEAVAKSA